MHITQAGGSRKIKVFISAGIESCSFPRVRLLLGSEGDGCCPEGFLANVCGMSSLHRLITNSWSIPPIFSAALICSCQTHR